MLECNQYHQDAYFVLSICPRVFCKYQSLRGIRGILGFSYGGNFCVYKISFWFVNSIRFFNTALVRTMYDIGEDLFKQGLYEDNRQWMIMYAYDATV